jgi:hypothetical protein
MIDIHSHVLHGLDDGAPSFDISLAMAKLALESGTTDIVATPHANAFYSYQPAKASERTSQLQQAIGDSMGAARASSLFGQRFELSASGIPRVILVPGYRSGFQGAESRFDADHHTSGAESAFGG